MKKYVVINQGNGTLSGDYVCGIDESIAYHDWEEAARACIEMRWEFKNDNLDVFVAIDRNTYKRMCAALEVADGAE